MASPESGVELDPSITLAVQGESVAATRYEPISIDGPLPAVLWYTPYHKDDETTYGRYEPLLEYVAASGYEVVVADMVGTGASTGHRGEFFGPEAGAEAAAVIEELAARPWTTGRVGMLGKSFPGTFCLLAAAENPDSLEAIVPILASHRRERLAFNRGGLQPLWLTVSMLALFQAGAVQPPSRRDDGWRERWETRLEHITDRGPPMARALAPDPDDPYWDWCIPVEEISVPTFAVGGYRDHFPSDTLEYFRAIDAPKRLLMGPWRHVAPYRGREVAIGFRQQVVDWFDRFLKDEPSIPFEPDIAYWTERGGGRQVGEGVWRGRSRWPTTNDEEVLSFAVTPNGLHRTDGYSSGDVERTHRIDHTVGLEAHDLSVPFVDTNADDARSMTFDSNPVDRPLELTGTGAAEVQVTADGPVPLCVRLVDVAPDAQARPVTRGAVRVAEEADNPVSVPLSPVSHIVEENHRLRVAISGADFPSYHPVNGADSFAISSTPAAPTTVRIPGGTFGSSSVDNGMSLPSPEESVPLAPSAVQGGEATWETTREHEHRTASRRRHARTEYALPHIDKTYAIDIEATVDHDDPSTISARATIETTLRYDDEPVTVETTVRRNWDDCSTLTTVQLGSEVVFDDNWSPEVQFTDGG